MRRAKTIDWDDEYSAPRRRLLPTRMPMRFTGWSLLTFVVIVLVYYGIGAFWINTIDDDLTYAPNDVPPGGSRAVAVAAALIERETVDHAWTPNDPWFFPTYFLDDMPNYQMGMIGGLWRFAIEMSDQIGRTRGSSEVDADLENAAGLLKYPPDRWVWNPSESLMPISSSTTQYQNARRSLLSYNQRLANGEAVFEKRADNLLQTLDRIAADLGSASATIEQHLAQPRPLFIDLEVDDIFYRIKGRLYAYSMILDGLGEDFAEVIQSREVGPLWQQMAHSIHQATELSPLWVENGAPDSAFFPNHLTSQGFYLLHARTRLREITTVLRN